MRGYNISMTNEYGGTCQFCEKFSGVTGRTQQRPRLKYDGKVKYGLRHYAHYECFLDHKGRSGFLALHGWQQRGFPYFLLKERGLLDCPEIDLPKAAR